MGIKEKDKSLLEIAIDLLQKKKKPQNIKNIITETMQLKGLKNPQAAEEAPQLILDIMQSGYFVYCGEDCWDLKFRQPTSVFDKDGADATIYEQDEEIKNNQLNDSDDLDYDNQQASIQTANDSDDKDEDEDDLEKAFDDSDKSFDDAPGSNFAEDKEEPDAKATTDNDLESSDDSVENDLLFGNDDEEEPNDEDLLDIEDEEEDR